MVDKSIFDRYLLAVRATPVDQKTEHTDRAALQSLLQAFADDFEKLSGLGWALIQAHLLRELLRRGLAAYHGRGDHTVEAVRYVAAEKAIAINKTQSFRPVPQEVWDFHIGGYQVLDKYLKSRRSRVLSLDEIEHVGSIADSLAFTIEQMVGIDAAYRSAFPDPA